MLKNKTIISVLLIGNLAGFVNSNCYADGGVLLDSRKKITGLVCDVNAHDFGEITISQATSCIQHFVLYNTSKQDINILDYSSTCGCTSIELSKNSIAPGEIISVVVKADWSSRVGKQKETVFLKTDFPATREIILTVEGFVVVRAILAPDRIDFGLLKPGQQKMQIVQLAQGADRRPFKVLGIENNNNYVSVHRLNEEDNVQAPMPLAGGAGEFAIIFTTPQIKGQYDAIIIFYTDIEDQREIKLPVTASSQGLYSIKPSTLLFSGSSCEEDLFQEIRIGSDVAQVIEPVTKILWKQDKPNPFYVKQIKYEKSENVVNVIVGFKAQGIGNILCRAILQLTFGKEVVDVPIIAIK